MQEMLFWRFFDGGFFPDRQLAPQKFSCFLMQGAWTSNILQKQPLSVRYPCKARMFRHQAVFESKISAEKTNISL
jgi:hypothetical protein